MFIQLGGWGRLFGMVPVLNHERRGAGAPVVAVHGLGLSHSIFRPLAECAQGSRELIAVDLPGFGESPPVPGRGVRPLVDALEAWLDAEGLERPHLVGNSMGGRIVLELAARGRAASVVSISPAGFGSSLENRATKANLLAHRLATRPLVPVADAFVRTAVARAGLLAAVSARPWSVDGDLAAAAIRSYGLAPGFRPALNDVVWGRPEGLDRIGCPVTILWGTRDLILPVTGAARAAEQLPRARVERLHGVGHIATFDDPARVASELLEASGGSK